MVAAGALAPGALGSPLQRRRALLYARPDLTRIAPEHREAMAVLGKTAMRAAGSLPNPALPAGTDTMPQIEHVVVVMMENHSYDNFLGMLGRGPFQTARGDGYTIAADGYPSNSNPQSNGNAVRAFHMPTTCQFNGKPTQEWAQAHIQYASGTNQGFVVSGSGDVAMGYWDQTDLPFTYALANSFPIGDRYFCSLLGQTDPNRRFLIAATSSGMTDDINDPKQIGTLLAKPAGGTIFSRLTDAGISWYEYAVQSGITNVTENLYPSVDLGYENSNVMPIAQFFTDAQAGTLPSFSLVDPNFSTESQENPQNVIVGEAWLRTIVEAIGSSPKWQQTMLIINYDEHGGYYDHVPPPAALAPDGIAPVVESGEKPYDGFKRYGFRVPSIVVSPYAKQNYVSHIVYDHTSVLAFVERKFNLEAMTLRDANANDMTDFLDLPALTAGTPTFPEFPALAQSGQSSATLACSNSGPGTIPTTNPPLPIQIRLGTATADRVRNALVVPVQASRGGLTGVTVELQKAGTTVASKRVPALSATLRTVALRVHGHAPKPGHYEVLVRAGGKTLARQAVHIRA
jgi:phospholipase C